MYNVLIVDDESIICEGLSRIIPWKENNFNIAGFAANGREAIGKIQKDGINLVVTDIRMPVIDGLELSRLIKEYDPKIEVIILSGYSDFQYAKKAMDYEVKAYLLKPVIPAELLEQVTKIRNRLDKDLDFEKEKSERNRMLIDKIVGAHKGNKLMDSILGYIDDHFCEDISLAQLASKFFVNAAYLGQLFKESSGMPFTEYLNKKRIDLAKQLCTMGEMKIYEIIEKSGFRNTEYFYRQFKRYEGVTFAEFREHLSKRT